MPSAAQFSSTLDLIDLCVVLVGRKHTSHSTCRKIERLLRDYRPNRCMCVARTVMSMFKAYGQPTVGRFR